VAEGPSWLPEAVRSVALRLARVEELIYTVGEACFSWSRAGPLQLVQHRSQGGLALTVASIRPIPPIVGLHISESINHLRAALDNVVFYMVADRRAQELTEKQRRAVSMPIHHTAERFDRWTGDMTRRGLPELAGAHELAERIRRLQPFTDMQRAVGSTSDLLGAMIGTRPEYEHPLTLLHGYSNADKHHALRVTAARAFVSRHDLPFFSDDRSPRPVLVGDVLHTIREGVPTIVDMNSWVGVERPDGVTWVPPARELHELCRYVSEVAVPILVTGSDQVAPLPLTVDLGDSGATVEERLAHGRQDSAQDRLRAVMARAVAEGYDAPPQVAPIEDSPDSS